MIANGGVPLEPITGNWLLGIFKGLGAMFTESVVVSQLEAVDAQNITHV